MRFWTVETKGLSGAKPWATAVEKRPRRSAEIFARQLRRTGRIVRIVLWRKTRKEMK